MRSDPIRNPKSAIRNPTTRPLVGVAIALSLGIALGYVLPARPALAVSVAAASAAAGAFLALRRASPSRGFAFALLSILACGAAYAGARCAGRAGAGLNALLRDEPRILRVKGFIDGIPELRTRPDSRDPKARRELTYMRLAVVEARLNGRWVPARGRLRAFGEGRAAHLAPGDALDVALRAWRASPPMNPGQFDYRSHLERSGVSGLADIGLAEGLRPIGRRIAGLRWVAALKRRMSRVLDERVAQRPAAVLKRLILGERYALAEDQLRVFRETGTVHFLAISGLHVGIVALFCWWVLLMFRVGHRASALTVLGVVLGYALLAGFRPSVLRAAVMCAVVCGAFVLDRKPDLPGSLALAVIVILVHEPAQILSAGFQLSFVAVLGICLFAGPIERALFGAPDELDRLVPPEEREWVKHPVRWVLQKALSVSLAAWLVTLPLMAQYFGAAAPFAPLLSVALLPAVWLALVAGLPGVLLAPLLGDYVQPLLTTAAFGARTMESLCALLTRVPGVVVYLPPPGPLCLLLSFAALTAIAFRRRLRLTPAWIAVLALAPALVYLGFVWRPTPPRRLRVRVLATGQGNCVLAQFPDGRNVLFDAGGRGPGDVGGAIIAPALWSLGVRRLDLVVLSHLDADHCNGFAETARRIPVGRVAIPTYALRRDKTGGIRARVAASGAVLDTIGAGDRVAGVSGAEIEVLWPPRALPLAGRFSDNELSALVRIRSRDGTVLLTGDFGRRAVGALLDSGADLKADLLQVSHHGLPDFAAPRFAAAVAPEVAVIPGGRNAERPSPYAEYSGRLLATDRYGTITVEMERDRSPHVATWLRGDL